MILLNDEILPERESNTNPFDGAAIFLFLGAVCFRSFLLV